MTVLGWVLLSIGIGLLILFLLWLVLERLYKRSSKETAFVRTGFRGQKVVITGGALVLPVLHEIIPVNMNTLRLGVTRANTQALITRDRMRVDVQAEFYVRVKPTPEHVADAAQTLGRRTMNPEKLQELLEGKFVDALRAVAAEMNMEEIHEQRVNFVRKVQSAVAEDLLKNGLELESVSLAELNQTDQKYFNPQNAFDARGLTALTEEIQARRRQRNVIERDTEVAIQKKNLEAERQKLELSKEEEFARLEQQREIEVRRAEQQTNIVREQVEKEQQAREAQILAKQRIDRTQLQAEQVIEEERIARDLLLREKEIAKSRSIEAAEIEKDRLVREAQIAAAQLLEKAKIESGRETDQARLAAEKIIEEERIARDLYVKEKEITRDRAVQAAEIEKDRLIKEAQITVARLLDQARIEAQQQLEQARIAAERLTEEERIANEQAVKERTLARDQAVEAAEIEKERSISEERIQIKRAIDLAQLTAERALEEERIAKELHLKEKDIARATVIETAEIERQKAVLLAEQERLIALAQKSKETAAVQAEAENVRALSAKAEEQVLTARQMEIAERQKALELIEARKKAEREAIGLIMAAEARRKAALEEAERDRTLSTREAEKLKIAAAAEAEAEISRIKAAEKRYSVEAAGTRALHEAENVLDPNVIAMRIKMEVIKHLGEIIRESVKPIESIEGIKIIHVEGLGPLVGNGRAGAGDTAPGGGNLAEQLVNSALRYRGQAPLVDAVLKEIGLAGGDLSGLTAAAKPDAETPPEKKEED